LVMMHGHYVNCTNWLIKMGYTYDVARHNFEAPKAYKRLSLAILLSRQRQRKTLR